MKRDSRDEAAQLATEILAELRTSHSNLGALVLYLARQSPAIRRRVLDELKTPQPRSLPDHEWLDAVEGHRKVMLRDGLRPKSERDVVRDLLKSGTRHGAPGRVFLPHTRAGELEVDRVCEAAQRARRRKKAAKIA